MGIERFKGKHIAKRFAHNLNQVNNVANRKPSVVKELNDDMVRLVSGGSIEKSTQKRITPTLVGPVSSRAAQNPSSYEQELSDISKEWLSEGSGYISKVMRQVYPKLQLP